MGNNWVPIKGVIPPMITPFDEIGDVDQKAFIHNIEKWNADKLAGYLVNGSNSEAASMNWQEKLILVELTVKYGDPERHIMAGTGCESLRETVSLTKASADLGAQSALVLTPHYYDSAMDSAHLVRFYMKLADESPIPILIYNVPNFTHVNIQADAVEQLSKHPNIVGMKDSTGNVPQMATFLRVADEDFQIFVGTASAWYPALCLGIQAGILALANCAPNQCALVQETYDNGEFDRSLHLYQALFPINHAVTSKYSIPGLKYACELNGYKGGHIRSPLLNCSEENKADLRAILNDCALKLQTII